jgi:diketogulonate reductase-like aldo/keto reductase
LACKYGKTPAQVILRWHIQHGFCAITKEAECEVTDDWMLEAFGSGAVQFDVVRRPPS